MAVHPRRPFHIGHRDCRRCLWTLIGKTQISVNPCSSWPKTPRSLASLTHWLRCWKLFWDLRISEARFPSQGRACQQEASQVRQCPCRPPNPIHCRLVSDDVSINLLGTDILSEIQAVIEYTPTDIVVSSALSKQRLCTLVSLPYLTEPTCSLELDVRQRLTPKSGRLINTIWVSCRCPKLQSTLGQRAASPDFCNIL